jgi:hypothetical protein
MADHHVDLLERALVEEEIDPLAGCELALFVLASDGAFTPGVQRFFA